MAEEITAVKESRPMSANNPLRCKKTKHNNKKNKFLSEKENEQLNKLTKKNKFFDLLNSPYKNEMKDFLNDKTTTKNLYSEIKETKTKTRLPKIKYSANILESRKKTIKLGTIDANKVNNNQRNKLEINCGGITNKQSNNGIFIQDTFKEKEKLNNIKTNFYTKNKNNKSIDKINITINQKKKMNNQEDNNKKGKKSEEIKNINTSNNIKKSISINNQSLNKEKKEIKINKENNNKRNNNYIEVNTKNSNDNKTVKFNKEISIINILKESNDEESQNNDSLKEE